MSDEEKPEADGYMPEAELRPRHGLSAVWLIPLVALVIAAWLGYHHYFDQGPTIAITFSSAEGIEAGRTKVKFKDVEVGEVERVQVTHDLKHVLITARMVRGLEPHMNEGTRFWVVKPRVGSGGVSGLDTLVSGAFIEIDPGEGEPKYTFEGLEEPPLVRFDVPGRQFMLEAENVSGLSRGAPIYYHGLEVGQILGYTLSPEGERFDVPIFIHAPHDELVRENSRFWTASAVRVEAGADGVGLEIGTLQSILSGGVSFDSPDLDNVERAEAGRRFGLYPDLSSVGEARFTRSLPFLVFFEGSVRGLRAGAPVEIRGMKIGEVRDVRLNLDDERQSINIPVTLDIQPQRISGRTEGSIDDEAAYAEFDALVRQGLRAQLKTGSLITGELYVDLVFDRRRRHGELDFSGEIPVIPAIPSDLDALAASLENALSRVAELPLEELVQDLQSTIRAIDSRIRAPEIDTILEELVATTVSVREVAGRLDTRSEPLLRGLGQTLASAERAIGDIGRAAAEAQDMLDDDSSLRFDLQDLLRELNQAARSIRVFAEYLERHPEALVRGKGGGFQ